MTCRAILFHSSMTNCCNCLIFLGPLPITSQMCSAGLRSGERQNIRSVSLQKHHIIVVQAEWQGAHPASGAYLCYINYHVYSIKMHTFSQFRFVPECWLKRTALFFGRSNSISSVNLAFAIRVVSNMLNRPPDLQPHAFCSNNELPNQKDPNTMWSRQAQIW